MNLIIDENVSFGLVGKLRRNSYKVVSIAERKAGTSDEEIFALIKSHKAIFITRDYHFTNSIRFPAKDTKGIIYIRHGNLTAQEEIELIQRFLNSHSLEWLEGKLVFLSKEDIRIR